MGPVWATLGRVDGVVCEVCMGRILTLVCLMLMVGGCATTAMQTPCSRLHVTQVNVDEPVPESLWEATDSATRNGRESNPGESNSVPGPDSLMDVTSPERPSTRRVHARVTRD